MCRPRRERTGSPRTMCTGRQNEHPQTRKRNPRRKAPRTMCPRRKAGRRPARIVDPLAGSGRGAGPGTRSSAAPASLARRCSPDGRPCLHAGVPRAGVPRAPVRTSSDGPLRGRLPRRRGVPLADVPPPASPSRVRPLAGVRRADAPCADISHAAPASPSPTSLRRCPPVGVPLPRPYVAPAPPRGRASIPPLAFPSRALPPAVIRRLDVRRPASPLSQP